MQNEHSCTRRTNQNTFLDLLSTLMIYGSAFLLRETKYHGRITPFPFLLLRLFPVFFFQNIHDYGLCAMFLPLNLCPRLPIAALCTSITTTYTYFTRSAGLLSRCYISLRASLRLSSYGSNRELYGGRPPQRVVVKWSNTSMLGYWP